MTINANEYKSVIGLDSVYVAEVLTDSSLDYSVGEPEILAPAAEISLKPVSSMETQYMDNQPYDVFAAEAETDMEITLSGVPTVMLAKLLGSSFDAMSGRLLDNGSNPPYMALGFRTMKSNGSYRYYWFQKVKFSPPEDGMVSKADKATPKTVKMICKAIKTAYKWDLGSVTDGVKRIYGDEDTDNFYGTDWFSWVQMPVNYYYVDQTGGNDSNSGRTEALAWKTIAKVNSSAGDGSKVLLKCGETWAEMLTVGGDDFYIGNYGSGALPVIDGEAARDHCIYSMGKDNVSVDGVKVIGGVWEAIYIGTGYKPAIRHCKADGVANAGFMIENCTNIDLYFNSVVNADGNGISVIGCTHGDVWYNDASVCAITTDDRSGINLYTGNSDIRVHHNISFDNVGPSTVGARGIIVDTNGDAGVNYVYQNIVWGNNGGGIEIYLSNNQRVYYNVAYNNGDTSMWFDGIYMHDCTGGVVYHNTCYNNKNSSIRCYDAIGCTIKNNIGWQTGNNCFITEGTSATTHIVDYNNWYGVANEYEWNGTTYANEALFYAATGQGQHDRTTDPLCVSVSDYHLQAGSPCRGAGVDVGLLVDFDGVAVAEPPDIGAYQYV